MKIYKTKFLSAILMISIAMPSMAQFSNTEGEKNNFTVFQKSSYNRFAVGYKALLTRGDYFNPANNVGNNNFNGFSVKYMYGFGLSKRIPIYIEPGLNANMFLGSVYSSEPYFGYNIKYKQSIYLLSICLPINISYKFSVASNISIQPHTGINFRLNVLGKSKIKFEDSVFEDLFGVPIINLFSDEETYNQACKRFQMGWQIGLGCNIQKLYIGIEYGIDFMELAPKLKTSHLEGSIGVNF